MSWRAVAWGVAVSAALLAGATWLRNASVVYLVVTVAATAAALVAARGHRLRLVAPVLLTVFAASGAWVARTDDRLAREWPTVRDELGARAVAAVSGAVDRAATELEAVARAALEAPAGPAAFGFLGSSVRGGSERGLVLYRDGNAAAWAGTTPVSTDSLRDSVGIVFAPFYVVIYASAARGPVRAVATAVVHAEPPADRLARALDMPVAARFGVRRFDYTTAEGEVAGDGRAVIAPTGRPLLAVHATLLAAGEVREAARQAGRVRGGLLIAAAALCFLIATWRGRTGLPSRLASLGVVLWCVGVAPLSAYSNASRLFDPSLYFSSVGGAWTANVAALGLTSALVLLGAITVLRAPGGYHSRTMALAVVLLAAGAAPYVMRDLADGIVMPLRGVSGGVWLAWEMAIFLAATSIVLAGVSAGRAALAGRRGVTTLGGPLIAFGAALLGPLLWEAPGRWPWWYPLLWVVAVIVLALGVSNRNRLIASATVAALGAAVLVWAVTARARVALAERDIAGLAAVDPDAATLARRFAVALRTAEPPASRAALARLFRGSDLADAGYPVSLAAWGAGGVGPRASLDVTDFVADSTSLRATVAEVRRTGTMAIRSGVGPRGSELVVVVPLHDGSAVSIAVAPSTRLVEPDPLAALLGLAPAMDATPPYSLALADADTSTSRASSTGWRKKGHAVHGDWLVRTSRGLVRAHAEVELRALDALVERGALVALLDVSCVVALWLVSAASDGGLRRWLRMRRREWRRSYRAQLVFALFAFFVVPAAAFAAWSYRQLQRDDAQARALLLGATLRRADSVAVPGRLAAEADRLQTPLLLYARGELTAASDILFDAVAPFGRMLPPEVYTQLALSDELTASASVPAGPRSALLGFRVTRGVGGEPLVLAAPARTSEAAVDGRRHDLGVFVLFATVLGAAAALWLSGVAARQLARPINALRSAALAIAGGEREPLLRGSAPAEFGPVFAAFRRMAADLNSSRAALEEAQRRTAAVLRNVASGVVAVDPDARLSLANPRAEAILGTALPAGSAIADVVAAPISDRVRHFVDRAADEDEFEIELGGRQLHVRLARLSRGGAVLTLDDVSDLARAQRVLAWGEMARQVAHEIKNPLTPIRLGVQHLRRAHLARRPDFDAILAQNVARILGEIDRLDEIARAFSRYGSSAEDRLPPEPTDVAAVVRGVIELESMGEGSVSWQAHGVEGSVVAAARDNELREALLNVLENSRHAGARHVDVRVTEAGGRVHIVIDDDGEGIASELLPRIFEPHFSTRTSGSGLGLAISRRLVDGWGGEMLVASERGRGTRVELVLRGEATAGAGLL